MINEFNKKGNSRFASSILDRQLLESKRSQLTIFIILAIVIVGIIVLFFVLRGETEKPVPQELEPIYDYYLSCIEGELFNGVSILGQQGGYIGSPEFYSGSEYMPFSSELDFLGFGVPYWYYISGNGVAREQIPSKEKMVAELEDFLEQRFFCDFSGFEESGFEIDYGALEVSSDIGDERVEINVVQDVTVSFGETSWTGKSHKVSMDSRLGKFYDLAEKIYLKNKDEMFLENYGVDILRLYAPVDGSEVGCSSKVWLVDDIRADLINALELNIPQIKIKGDYYNLGREENKYFVQDIGEDVSVNVNFMYIGQWPSKIEVWPSEGDILKADPVGLQEGLGMLGFCYVPYHFVYDFAFPVLIQLYSGTEMFQFPVVVYIEKNNPRESLDVEALPAVIPELCEYKNTVMSVYTYDTDLQPINAEIKYKCFDTTCSIGETNEGILTEYFPQCINGFIIVEAEGYETGKYVLSTIQEDVVDVILNKKYTLDLEIQKSDSRIEDYAVISFTKGGEVRTYSYPSQTQIELIEGQYEIKLYIYSNASIQLKGSESLKCVDIPKAGFFGIFGGKEEKCFPLVIPDQTISFAVSGGGTQNYYMSEFDLESDKIIVNADNFGFPTKVEDLQLNYNKIELSELEVMFE